MKKELASLGLAFLAFCPFSSSADQDLQARFEKSLSDAKSISNLEIEWLDTLTLQHPPAIIATNGKVFSRTFQYSFIASGQKYRATCKLISGTQTNLVKFSESAFDGDSYATYSSGSQQMTKGSKPPLGGEGESSDNPLIAPFMFLSSHSNDGGMNILRFTDIISDEFAKGYSLPTGSSTNGLLEIIVSSHPVGGHPTWCVIGIDEAGDSFTPTIIKQIAPGQEMEMVSRLLNYTNLGAYHFPTKIEWTMSSYPPNDPPNLLASGTVSVISARTPDQVADSVFKMDSEEKEAASVWDWDQQKLIKSAPRDPKLITSCMVRTNISK
jgi:hypothetical protein